MRNKPQRRAGENGITAFLYILALVFIIIPMLGLAIDVGFLYAVRSKMQAAVDGAALAAARALSIGQSLDSQKASAKSNAVTWFNANFPSNYFGVASVSMDTSDSHVNVYTDTTNTQLRHVQVTAQAVVNTIFMRWFGKNSVTVGASGNASRRTVVAMLVLDRSGSMCQPNSGSCDENNSTLPCASLVKASKLFTGQFAATSDYIGMLSFADNVYIHSLPTTDFQTKLGYTNSSGTGNGELDTLTCFGKTGTAQAISMAYQAIEQVNLPGALNVIVLETDGMPNSLVLSFWDSTNAVAGLTKTGTSASACTDTAGKTAKGGGFNKTSVLPAWAGSMSLISSPFSTYHGTGVPYGSLTNYMIGGVFSDDPGDGTNFYFLGNYFTSSRTYSGGKYGYNVFSYVGSSSASGCGWGSGKTTTNPTDFAWFPATDVYGNSLNPSYGYQTVSTDGSGHISLPSGTSQPWSNYHKAVLNATENAAYQARTNTTIPVTFVVVGLGGNGAIDPVLLQRIANDPSGDMFNSPAAYDDCSSESDCKTWTTGSDGTNPQGVFVYSSGASNLGPAFLRVSSQVLRLSQ